MEDPAEPRYSADELIAAARARGFDIKKRLVADWVSIGLLDRGTDRGRGRARGKDYLWSENQRRLFLTLLDKHQTVRRPVLLNIPASLWLIWGDNYVPLRQARRAIATWSGANHRAGIARARLTARKVVAELEHPKAGRETRKRLRDLVTEAAYGQTIDQGALLEAANAVYMPASARPTDPEIVMTPETYVRVVQARLEAVRCLAAVAPVDKPIPDDVFLAARQTYLTTGPTARMAAAPLSREEHILAPAQMPAEEIINSACLHLLTVLGFALLAPNRLPVGGSPTWPAPTKHGLRRAQVTK